MTVHRAAVRVGERARVIRHLARISWRVDRAVTGITLVLSAGIALATAGLALAQRWVIDGLRGPDHGWGVLLPAVVVGALAQLAWVMGTKLRNTFRSGLISKIDVELAKEVIGDISQCPSTEHLDRPDYLDRVYLAVRGTYALSGYALQLLEVITAGVSLLASVWILAAVDPWLLLLVAVSLITLQAGSRAHRAARRANQETAATSRLEMHLHNLCLDSASAKEIRIAGSGGELSDRAEALWDDVTSRYVVARLQGAGLNLAGWACYAAGLAVALTITADQVVSGATRVGSLVLVISLTSQLRGQLSSLQDGWSRAAEAGEVSNHYLWLKAYAAGFDGGGGPAPERLLEGISLEQVGFSYPGSNERVLSSIDARFAAGSVIGLVGINGAGKSTLIKLLTGLYQPTSGRILVDGRPLPDIDPHAWAAAARGVFQDFAKFEFLTRESVGVGDLPRIDDRRAVSAALADAGADPIVESLPEGIDTQLGALFSGAQLSHGQWQRIALARGLMRELPLLLVLDEPTAALDPQAEHEMFESFADQARQATARTGAITVLVSHRFSTVDMADHIFVVSDGVIAESGSHKELMAAEGRYAKLYATQAAAYAVTTSARPSD